MDNFKKQENTTIRSWYLNWTHEQIIVDKHQRKCKNSCEKFQALKSIGSQHKLGLENIEETSYTLLPFNSLQCGNSKYDTTIEASKKKHIHVKPQ